MQSLQDQVEEAERRHSAVEGQVSCVNMFHCTVTNAFNIFSFPNSAFTVYMIMFHNRKLLMKVTPNQFQEKAIITIFSNNTNNHNLARRLVKQSVHVQVVHSARQSALFCEFLSEAVPLFDLIYH